MVKKRLSEFHVGDFDDSNLPHIDGVQRRGLMLALSSPSGAGKTTMSRLLLEADPDVELSVSYTNRKIRPGEKDGFDYHFISDEEFLRMIDSDELLEHVEFHGNRYGIPKAPIVKAINNGKDIMFVPEHRGMESLALFSREDLVSVYILPPTATELEARLVRRGQDSEEVIKRRMHDSWDQISYCKQYDYVIINRDLEDSMLKLRTILGAERMKTHRLKGLDDFVVNLRDDIKDRYL